MNTEPTNTHDLSITLKESHNVREKAQFFLQPKDTAGGVKVTSKQPSLDILNSNNTNYAKAHKALEAFFLNQKNRPEYKDESCANDSQKTDLNHHQNQLICDSTTSSSSILSNSSNNHIPIPSPLLSSSFLQNKSCNNLPKIMLDTDDGIKINSKSQDSQVKNISTQTELTINSIINMLEQLKLHNTQATTSSVYSEDCVDSGSEMIGICMNYDKSCSDI